MPRAPRISRTQVVALSRPAPLPAAWADWAAVAFVLALLLAGLLGR